MRYQDTLVRLIEDAYIELFKNGERLGDKLNYKASETTRTPLEMMVECVTNPPFLGKTIADRAMAPFDESATYPDLTSVEACKAHYESVKGTMLEAIRSFPDDKLMEEIATPWGTFKWYDFMAYAYWNPMYHVGQMAYIQMIHGDTAMDF